MSSWALVYDDGGSTGQLGKNSQLKKKKKKNSAEVIG